jgi:hypothetical protein
VISEDAEKIIIDSIIIVMPVAWFSLGTGDGITRKY